MRKLILGLALSVVLAPAMAADPTACRDAGEFTRASAQARDNGALEVDLKQAVQNNIGREDRELYTLLVQLAFSARNATPAQLSRDVRESCTKGAWYK